MYRGHAFVILLTGLLALSACAPSPDVGGEGQSCTTKNACLEGLVCGTEKICVKAGETDGGPDSGFDSGSDASSDSSYLSDAAQDSGPDAGQQDGATDSGMDSGMDGGTDSGVDDGSDAGQFCESVTTPVENCKLYNLDGGSEDSGNWMCEVPAGCFMMGCNSAVDTECQNNEKPFHKVNLSAYKVDKYEVAVAQYTQCVETDGGCSGFPADAGCIYGIGGKENYPINCASWNQAIKFCTWAGKRLPSEAEWEKAARGVDGRKYPWGNSPKANCNYSVMNDADAGGIGCGVGGSFPVGSKPDGTSPYGVLDLAGNIWEWVNDWYASGYYSNSPIDNPKGPTTGTYRIKRGGDYSSNALYQRTSYRYYDYPYRQPPNYLAAPHFFTSLKIRICTGGQRDRIFVQERRKAFIP